MIETTGIDLVTKVPKVRAAFESPLSCDGHQKNMSYLTGIVLKLMLPRAFADQTIRCAHGALGSLCSEMSTSTSSRHMEGIEWQRAFAFCIVLNPIVSFPKLWAYVPFHSCR